MYATATSSTANIETHWAALKNLSDMEKLLLISRLSEALLQNKETQEETPKRKSMYGALKDKITYIADDFDEPLELVTSTEISTRTLRDMDKAVANLKAGKVSKKIDLNGRTKQS